MTGFLFNIDGGYLEGLCRGFKCGVLKQSDYLNLVQCETLEGINNLVTKFVFIIKQIFNKKKTRRVHMTIVIAVSWYLLRGEIVIKSVTLL